MFTVMLAGPCAQFCARAFADYGRFTDVDLIFGSYVEHMGGFGWFFRTNFFVFVLLGALVLAALYLYWFPVDKDAAAAAKIRAKLEELEGYDMETGQTHADKKAKKAAILDGEAARKRKESKGWFKNPLAKKAGEARKSAGAGLADAKKSALARGKKATKKAKKEAAKFALAMH